jgi:hypothetical protein
MTRSADNQVTRLDNHRIFRAEAVEAYTTRRAGDVWAAGIRWQGWIVAGLTAITAAAIVLLFLGER